ncbi:MAG: acyl-CoA dehydrogenase [Bacteroidota bacterium]
MSTNPPIRFTYSPAIQSLIPLLYAAWSDQVLSPSEVRALKAKGYKLSFLTDEDREVLLHWTNPKQRPTRQLSKYWELQMQQSIADFGGAHGSLVDLGLMMAKKAAQDVEHHNCVINWAAAPIRAELEALENQLVLVSLDTYHRLFPDTTPKEKQLQESFDSSKMAALLDDDYGDARTRVKALLSDPVFQYKTLPHKEAYREQVLEWCQLLAAQGLGAISYPEEYGGKNDMGVYAAVFETLGYHDLSLAIKFGVQFGLFGGSIHALGTKYHHDLYLDAVGKMKLPGCFAMTETGHGSNVRELETTATYDPNTDSFIVHSPNRAAGKEYIGNAMHGRMATVFVQLLVDGKNHGVHAVLVPLRDEQYQLLPGITVEDCGYKLGLNGVDNGRIWFNQVKVPRQNLLNRFGDVDEQGQYTSPIENPSKRFFTMLGTLVGGRVCVPRAGLSAAKSGLAIAIGYGLKRRQFAPNPQAQETLLLDYPSHQRRLMPHLAKAYALDFALTYLTKRYVERTEEDMREIETLAAGLKSYSTWFTTEVLQECREACGGKGYLAENRFAALKADTDVFTTFEGDNTVLMQLVARGVLSDFRKEFHEEGNMAVLRYLGDRVSTAFTELNPFAIRNTDRQHLLSTEFHQAAFRFREKRTLHSLANRMQRHIRNGSSSYEAFLKCQTHMLSLAEAFVERLILDEFVKVVEKCDDSAVKTALQELYQLFALSTIEKNKGWFFENEYLTPAKSKAIVRIVDEWCGKVRKNAQAYIDAFGIPDHCLAAEIIVGATPSQ